MSYTPCPKCGNSSHPPGASFCPACGFKLRPSTLRSGWSVVLALVVFVCGFGLYKISTAPAAPPTVQPKAFVSTQDTPAATPLPALPQARPTEPPATSRPSRPAPPVVDETAADDLPAEEDDEEATVYVTRTGKKYHRAGCRYLSRSMIPISLEDAQAGYDPCSVCDPPE